MKKSNNISDLRVIKWIIKVLDKDVKYIWYLNIIRIFQGVEGTIFALLLKDVTNAATSKDAPNLIKYVIYIAIVVLLAIIFYILSIYVKEKANAVIEKRFRLYIIEKIFRLDYEGITSKHIGDWLTLTVNDSNIIYQVCLEIFPSFIGTIAQFIAASGAMIFTNLTMSFAFLVGGLALIAFSFLLRTKLKEFQLKVIEIDSSLKSELNEKLASSIIVKSYNQEANTLSILGKKSDDLIREKINRTKFTTFCSTCMYGSMRIAYFAGVFLFGYLILKGKMSYGDMIADLQIITLIVTPISNISTYIPQFYNAIASAERIINIENMNIEDGTIIKTPESAKEYYDNEFKKLVLDNVSFSYSLNTEYENNVINNISATIEKSDTVAIVGKSGCGKSTLLKLLMCLYSKKDGHYCAVDNNGETKEMTAEYRNMFAYVPQGNFLESGKIRDVITFFDADKSKQDEKIWRALKIACADEFVFNTPNKLDYELKEKGAGLSEGQIQRLAIARAILSERPILMLDECTSSLDEKTEKKLLENIKTMTNCTIVLITHRPAALEICNKVIDF